jgi:hypothetical protein
MIRFAVCAAVVLVSGLLNAEEPKKDWLKIAPDKQKYEVEFPAKPTEKVDKERGNTLYLSQVKREAGNGLLMLHVYDVPLANDLSNPESVKTALDKIRDSVKNQLPNSKIVAEKDAQFNNKHPERDLDIEQAKIGIYRTRIILTPKAIFHIAVVGPKDFVDGADAKKFFGSFKIKD